MIASEMQSILAVLYEYKGTCLTIAALLLARYYIKWS
jgi:hypothetical protein